MKKLFLIVLPILCIFAKTTFASESGSITKVDKIYIATSGTKPFIYFGADSLPGCHANSGAYLPVVNEAVFSRIYSTVLSAQASQKPVKVYYKVKEGQTGWGMCDIEAIFLYSN
ncbi:hypothetical protein FLL45_00390 [Aliikangiella marina]|uniref:Uncharacterized protein n=1 Tax=Aliikangiella marina TaxID=1712262 RepID=A0A545TGV3_9GAMM|nr:hypothetical protein [Aliikangiella marina]TQV76459.1 hypothetical protein FLL45_00390 [Aliikangiella marina]